MIIARKLAGLIMESSTCIYSQWSPGDSNNVADALSRDQHSSNSEFASSLLSLFSEQTPTGLVLFNLPKEIHLWALSLLQKLPNQQQLCRAHLKNMSGPSLDGNPSLAQLAPETISTSIITLPMTDTSSPVPLWKPSIPTSLVKQGGVL
jgi:hypothetical protein